MDATEIDISLSEGMLTIKWDRHFPNFAIRIPHLE
jgi:hypothetical protein